MSLQPIYIRAASCRVGTRNDPRQIYRDMLRRNYRGIFQRWAVVRQVPTDTRALLVKWIRQWSKLSQTYTLLDQWQRLHRDGLVFWGVGCQKKSNFGSVLFLERAKQRVSHGKRSVGRALEYAGVFVSKIHVSDAFAYSWSSIMSLAVDNLLGALVFWRNAAPSNSCPRTQTALRTIMIRIHQTMYHYVSQMSTSMTRHDMAYIIH